MVHQAQVRWGSLGNTILVQMHGKHVRPLRPLPGQGTAGWHVQRKRTVYGSRERCGGACRGDTSKGGAHMRTARAIRVRHESCCRQPWPLAAHRYALHAQVEIILSVLPHIAVSFRCVLGLGCVRSTGRLTSQSGKVLSTSLTLRTRGYG